MFDHTHYVPVLKCKQGERLALCHLAANADGITPLVEVDPLPSGDEPRTLEHHAELQFDQNLAKWGTQRPLFLDVEEIASDVGTSGAAGPDVIFDAAAANGLLFVPTIGPRRSSAEVAAALRHNKRGICLRLTDEDFAKPGHIGQFIAAHRLDPSKTDIVVDLGSMYESPLPRVEAVSIAYLNQLPNVRQWRTLTLCASTFPESMGELSGSSLALFPRTEWLSWRSLYNMRATFPRMPTFGDYGIQYPDIPEGLNFRVIDVAAAVRYALETEWLILKGQGMKRVKPGIQFPALAKALVARPEYMGAKHCQGCADILACASGKSGFSNSSAWRRIGATHHLELTRQQIRALPSF